jgi:enterochelin esterase-like enzyme
MKENLIFTILLFLTLTGTLFAQSTISEKDEIELKRGLSFDDPYTLGEFSKIKEGTPKGLVTKFSWTSDKIYPGTTRDYWVYIPKQYNPKIPACLVIFQDGGTYLNGASWTKGISPNTVFDNLIQQGEIPITIGLFVNPGDKGPGNPDWGGIDNRSFEYDAVTDQYSRFLLEELMPEIQRKYNITSNPKGRVLVGFSSGGICSFNAAWHRPDQFGNVISHCGSFVDIRGGHVYPELIRRTPKKPIRVHLQDGSNDLDLIWGNWSLSNQSMAKALEYVGYDYQFVFGQGGHNYSHAGQLFPETLKWIWRDYPK